MFADGTDRFVQGNLVAVGLDAQSMQHIARWLNLSETAFVLPPTVAGADCRLRIFTPANELPSAGHPTLGRAHAVVTAGLASPRSDTLVQQCGSGLKKLSAAQAANPFELDSRFVKIPGADPLPACCCMPE